MSAPPGEPLVAIIIVNWNGKDYALECLSSLRKLLYPALQIILVDNASTDGSIEAVTKSFPEVTILALKENLRFAGGNNHGIRHALERGADLILLLNNDTIVDPHCVTHLVNRIRSDNRNGMVAPKIYYFDRPDVIWYSGGEISTWTGTFSHTGIREKDRGQFSTAHDTDYATGCCLLATREVVKTIGLLDESYSMYTEDADWSMRARKAGFRIVFEPEAKMWHRISATAGDFSWFKMSHKLFSSLRFFGRYAAWYQWLVIPWMSFLINTTLLLRQIFSRAIRS
jgi:GT2 family glycosyltransferase